MGLNGAEAFQREVSSGAAAATGKVLFDTAFDRISRCSSSDTFKERAAFKVF